VISCHKNNRNKNKKFNYDTKNTQTQIHRRYIERIAEDNHVLPHVEFLRKFFSTERLVELCKAENSVATDTAITR